MIATAHAIFFLIGKLLHTSWAENKSFKTNLLVDDAKQFAKNKHMAIDD